MPKNMQVPIEVGVHHLLADRAVRNFSFNAPASRVSHFSRSLLQIEQPVGQLRGDRRRHEMIDQDRIRPAANRRRFAQVVDDPGVDVGIVPRTMSGQSASDRPVALPGEDEFGAVRAEMNHGIRAGTTPAAKSTSPGNYGAGAPACRESTPVVWASPRSGCGRRITLPRSMRGMTMNDFPSCCQTRNFPAAHRTADHFLRCFSGTFALNQAR